MNAAAIIFYNKLLKLTTDGYIQSYFHHAEMLTDIMSDQTSTEMQATEKGTRMHHVQVNTNLPYKQGHKKHYIT